MQRYITRGVAAYATGAIYTDSGRNEQAKETSGRGGHARLVGGMRAGHRLLAAGRRGRRVK